MTLMIDTNAVPAQHRVEFWAKSSCDAYHPLHIGTDGTDRFWARMWADRLGAPADRVSGSVHGCAMGPARLCAEWQVACVSGSFAASTRRWAVARVPLDRVNRPGRDRLLSRSRVAR